MFARARILLDPDDSRDFGLVALVQGSTSVVYAHRCGGVADEVREIEGFAIPLGGGDAAFPLINFFRRFAGYPPDMTSGGQRWQGRELDMLCDLVSDVPCWTSGDGAPEKRHLALDKDRLGEVTDAWIPVVTPFGPGVLVFRNV